MTNTVTKKPVRVDALDDVPASFMLPQDQVESVSRILEANGISYWVDHISVSVNGLPYISTIHLRRGVNPRHVQDLLDAIP